MLILCQTLLVPRALTGPFHLVRCLHHGKGFPAAPVPEVDLVGSGNQQKLSRGVESQGGNGIVAICEPAFTATL